MQGGAGRGHGGSDHLLLCRYRGHVLVAGSQGAERPPDRRVCAGLKENNRALPR